MDDLISEIVYDPASFFHSYPPFTYSIKELFLFISWLIVRPEDFIVHEIADDLEEAGECDQTIPIPPNEESETTVDAVIPTVQAKQAIDCYDWDDNMKAEIQDFIEKAKNYGFKDVLTLPIPDNKKLSPEVLKELSVW